MPTNFNVNTDNNNIFYSFYSFYSFITVVLSKVGPSTSLGDAGSPAGRVLTVPRVLMVPRVPVVGLHSVFHCKLWLQAVQTCCTVSHNRQTRFSP